VVDNSGWAMAPSLALGLESRTRLTIGSQHLRQDNVPDYGLPWGTSTDPVTGERFETGAFNASPAVPQSNFYGLRDYDFEDVQSDVVTGRVDHSFAPDARLSNSSRYGRNFRNSAITAPRPPNRQLQRREMRNDALANQTNLALGLTTGLVRHDISAGVEVGREETYTRNSAQSANQPQTNLRAPNPDDRPFGAMPDLAGNPGTAATSTQGVYLFDTASLGDDWQLSGGLRWDRSHVDYEQTSGATGAVTRLERTDSAVSWRGGVVFKPTLNSSLYAGYGTSFSPSSEAGNTGAALSDNPNAVNSINLEPEKTRNVEVGSKVALFEDRLSLSGAVFRTEKTNARTRNLNNEPFVLAGRQRVQGVEVGAAGRLGTSVSLLASYAFMDSEIVDSANPAERGHDLARTPRHTASLWATWQVRPRFEVGGGAQFMDAVFRNTTSDLTVPSYWLGNAMATYEVNQHLSLRLNVTNLTDAEYVDRVGGGHYIPGPRRSVQLTTDVRF
jgi:catecholate siderophore receptor